MKRRAVIKNFAAIVPAAYLSRSYAGELLSAPKDKFLPTWDSLKQYTVPDWFRDAKFGIWAHWGPQCQPEFGDWYARGMYQEGSEQYNYHVKKYGHPSKFGFKDVINEWKAENWQPEELLALYKRAGAKYFMAMANHHDNFDMYDSTHQPWNSTKLGPKKDIIGGWAKAAKNNGLPFGVTVHAAHTWLFMEAAQRADKKGELAGVPYDGKIAAADGKGKWWNGLNPQSLYEQDHAPSKGYDNDGAIHSQWNWGNNASVPSEQYIKKFLDRTIELIDKYKPELIYFDDTALPLWPVSNAGLKIAAHMYNQSIKRNGKLNAALFGKILDEEQRKCMIWDIERGQSNQIEPYVWQTDTCIGSWHYDRRIFEAKGYKSAKTVIHTLADVVSKNGNLLLNIPVRGDGSIDSEERKVVEGIAEWMAVNSECIFDTRPWTVFGEGPAMEGAAPLSAQGFNEGKGKPFTAHDIRFTTKGNVLYAIALGQPGEKGNLITSLSAAKLNGRKITDVKLLGGGSELKWSQTNNGLQIDAAAVSNNIAAVYKIKGVI